MKNKIFKKWKLFQRRLCILHCITIIGKTKMTNSQRSPFNKDTASLNLRGLHLGYRAVLAPGSGT